MICKLCGTDNKDGSKFCKNCGQQLEAEPAASQTYDSQPEQSSTYQSEQSTSSGDSPQMGQEQDAAGKSQSEPLQYGPVQYNSEEHSASYKNGKDSGDSVACLICGILSIVLSCCGIVGLGLGVMSIIFFVQEKKKGGVSAMTTVGLVCGIIGLVIGVLRFVIAGAGALITGMTRIYNR